MQNVKENLKFLSEAQQIRAKKARRVMQAIGSPTTTDLKSTLRMNLIKDSEITSEDVNHAEKVFGPDVGALKGKTTRTTSPPIKSQVIEMPDELLKLQEEITLSIDSICINGLQFLKTIAHDLYCRTSQPLSDNANSIECCQKLCEIRDIYRSGGFELAEVHADQ